MGLNVVRVIDAVRCTVDEGPDQSVVGRIPEPVRRGRRHTAEFGSDLPQRVGEQHVGAAEGQVARVAIQIRVLRCRRIVHKLVIVAELNAHRLRVGHPFIVELDLPERGNRCNVPVVAAAAPPRSHHAGRADIWGILPHRWA